MARRKNIQRNVSLTPWGNKFLFLMSSFKGKSATLIFAVSHGGQVIHLTLRLRFAQEGDLLCVVFTYFILFTMKMLFHLTN